ncbi:MAG: energy transducer TonB [Janthinobacterium lividum]
MLQPIQLEHVLACYRDDIGTVRRLLSRAALPLDSSMSLPAVVAKLETSRGFRRDLSLNLTAMAHMNGQSVCPADLLGIVAMAAAGPAFAATSDEAAALTLLQFVMEVCSRHEVIAKPQLRKPRFTFKRVAISAACVLLLAFGVLLWQAESDTVPPVANEIHFPQRLPLRQGPTASSAQNNAQPSTIGRPGGRIPQIRKLLVRLLPGNGHPDKADAVPAPIYRTESSAVPRLQSAPSTSSAQDFAPRSVASSAPDPATYRGTPPAVPTALLSQRLGARSIPANAYDEDRSYDARYPRLLRRQSQSAPAVEDDLLASNQPAPVLPETDSQANRSLVAGTVRPVSLGIMAGNLVYSPAPPYPAAASAARVQGEVRVQAEIDRDGNVASVRAISGPPLLRDAALYAVQRWRYRPYLSAGKPVATSALAVMEFELP